VLSFSFRSSCAFSFLSPLLIALLQYSFIDHCLAP
jgi:hypothetical protein